MLLDRALDARDARRKAYREEGREERQRVWMAWYERLEAARRDGREFDEPPPFIEANAEANARSDNGRPA